MPTRGFEAMFHLFFNLVTYVPWAYGIYRYPEKDPPKK